MCDFSDDGLLRTFSKTVRIQAAATGIAKISQLSSSCQGRRYCPSRQAVQTVNHEQISEITPAGPLSTS
jgi:hypothetical protein